MEKRCAVEKEDYDLAKEKKQQMACYRAQVYEQLELHGLLHSEPEVRGRAGVAATWKVGCRLRKRSGNAGIRLPCAKAGRLLQ